MGFGTIALIVARFSRFAIATLIIQRLSSAAWGEVAFAVAVVQYMAYVLEFGLVTLSQVHAPDDPTTDRRFFNLLVKWRFLAAFAIVVPTFLVVSQNVFVGSATLRIYLLFLLIRPLALDWMLYRKGHAGMVQIIQAVRQGILFIVLLTVPEMQLIHFIVLDLLSELLSALTSQFVARSFWKVSWLWQRQSENHALALYKTSLPLFAASFFLLMHQNVDILVLRALGSLEEVGRYDYAFKIMTFVLFIGASLSAPLRRQLSRQPDAKISAQLIQSSRKVLFLVSLSFHWFVLYAFPFLTAKLEIRALEGVPYVLQILSVDLLIAFYNIPVAEWLIASRKRREYVVITLIGGGLNLILNILAIPHWGIAGAAFSTVAAEAAMFFAFMLIVKSTGGINQMLRLFVPLFAQIAFFFAFFFLPEHRGLIGVLNIALVGFTVWKMRYWSSADIRILRQY